jgi:hypothetical protein
MYRSFPAFSGHVHGASSILRATGLQRAADNR